MEVGHGAEGDLGAGGSGDQYVGKVLRIAPVLRRVAYGHGEAPPPFDCCSDVVFADGGLNHVLNRTHVDAVAGRGFRVGTDVEIQTACDLLWINVACTFHGTYHIGDFACLSFEDSQIGAEDFDANLRPDSRRQHVDTIDDRLRPDIRDTGERNPALHLTLDFSAGRAMPPPISRLQVHDGLGHFEP